MINYSKFKCKYLNKSQIQESVDELIEEYQINKYKPVDIELLIYDIGLKLDIKTLDKSYDAFLKINNKEIAVNLLKYEDDRFTRRLRFSLAHELGHYILHRESMSIFNFDSPDEYLEFMQNIPQIDHNKFEFQANLFAGLLLMNEVALSEYYDLYMTETWNTDSLSLVNHLANKFEVSEEAMERRLTYFLKNELGNK